MPKISYALPNGVEKVSINNWTKTREVEEISSNLKKINSEEIENIENINMNQNDEVDILKKLYVLGDLDMRSVKTVNYLEDREQSNLIEGNKILRTSIKPNRLLYSASYKTLKTWLCGNDNLKWENGNDETNIITWPFYSKTLLNSSTPIEWRMIEGKFSLTQEQFESIKNKEVQPVIGLESGQDMNTIIPFSNFINILIDEEFTHMNCTSYLSSTYKFKNPEMNEIGEIIYKSTGEVKNKKYCNETNHSNLSQHTSKNHIDSNVLMDYKKGNSYPMLGDISSYIESLQTEYKVSMILGQTERLEDLNGNTGGCSQLALYLIKNPKFNVNIKPYILDYKGQKIYINPDDKFNYSGKVLFDIEIQNNSSNYDYSNLNFQLIIKHNQTESSNLYINKEKATYDDLDITKNIKVNMNNEDNNLGINELGKLNKDDKITISSNDFMYEISDFNKQKEKVDYDYILEFNYLNENIFYKYEDRKSINIKDSGTLEVKINSDKDDYFYLNLEQKDKFINMKIKPNKSYKIDNLDYDTQYKLSIINSLNYENIENQIFMLSRTKDENTKLIDINVTPKLTRYFKQRKIEEITVDR